MSLPARNFSPSELQSWKATILGIYDRMRAKAVKPYDVEYGGLEFTVLPNVYAPEFFNDTLWYAEKLKPLTKGKSFLEVGTGTGVIGIVCALNGATVTITDINPDAVENANINVKKHRVDVSVLESDLYERLSLEVKFDFIFWAHPFNAWDMEVDDMLLRSGIDPRYESLEGYISGARKHLTENGRLLLGTGDSADLYKIQELADKNSYRMELIEETEQPLERGTDKVIRDYIYEFVPKHD